MSVDREQGHRLDLAAPTRSCTVGKRTESRSDDWMSEGEAYQQAREDELSQTLLRDEETMTSHWGQPSGSY